MDTLLRDLRYAARKLVGTPAFTATAILTLAVAIGATTAMFSIVDRVLLEPLPYPHPERLVFLESTDRDGTPMPASPTDLRDYQGRTRVFSAVAAVDAGENMALTRPALPAVRLNEARVGASFFSILGEPIMRGRGFVAGDDDRAAPKVAVLSSLAWQRYFGGDTTVIGRMVTLDGSGYRVVGIAAPSFTYPRSPDVWTPAVWRDYEIGDNARGFHSVTAIARLADGATVESARREVQAVATRIAREFPRFDAKIGAYLQPFQEYLVGDVKHALWAMFGAVGFVLLIACANVANLFLVRAEGRESEIAVRTALGASRRRLVRQLITESLLLSAIGAALGAVVAAWLVDAARAAGPASLPRLSEVAIDGRAFAFAATAAIVSGLLFGLVPAMHAAASDISQMLRERSRGGTRRGARVQNLLITTEMALAVVLLAGAGLLLRSFDRLVHVDPGFRAEHLVVFDAALAGEKYQFDAQLIRFADEVQTRLAALPGVQSVTVSGHRPMDPDPTFEATTSFTVDGEPKPEKGSQPESQLLPVSPSFFRTVGVQLVRGRIFDDADNRPEAAPVILVNEALVRKYFPNQNPIGKHLTFGISHTTTASEADSVRTRGEIVGIVRDVKLGSLSEHPKPASFIPYNLLPLGDAFAVRTTSPLPTVARAIRNELRAIDPNVPLYELGTMDEAVSQTIAQPRFYTILLGAFAAVALLLATLGVYGVIAYAVSQRTREFGIRIALGATTGEVSRVVLRRGIVLALTGMAVGVAAALVMTRAIRSLLFDVPAVDPITFIGVVVVLSGAAILASWLPARRAARVDPVIAMRAE
jgi:putative ABC transport system permease protein